MVAVLDSSILPELVSGRGTARRSRVGEGKPRTSCGYNRFRSTIAVAQHFRSPDAKRLNSSLMKPPIADFIVSRSRPVLMRLAVDFHREFCVAAIEIEHVGSARMLPTKLDTVWPRPKHAPQKNLRKAHFPPEPSSLVNRTSSCLRSGIAKHGNPPPPCFARSPSPRQARGESEDLS